MILFWHIKMFFGNITRILDIIILIETQQARILWKCEISSSQANRLTCKYLYFVN